MAAGSLHELAVGAEQNLEKLATGLAQAGVDPQTVTAVSRMADVCRKLITALGAGQEQTGNQQPPAPPAQQQPVPPPAVPEPHHSLASATAALHQHLVAAAQQRAGQGH